jgi:hypothetical protein
MDKNFALSLMDNPPFCSLCTPYNRQTLQGFGARYIISQWRHFTAKPKILQNLLADPKKFRDG